jgi:uncharacterized membrane protein affecting hemolysin expression
MEFTKNEQWILSTKNEAFQKVVLVMGIILIISSIAMVLLQINNINKAKKMWTEAHSYINQNIKPVTKQEIFLKSMLLENINRIEAIELDHQKEKMRHDLMFFLFVGVYLIATYYSNRNYIKLIRKLHNS